MGGRKGEGREGEGDKLTHIHCMDHSQWVEMILYHSSCPESTSISVRNVTIHHKPPTKKKD